MGDTNTFGCTDSCSALVDTNTHFTSHSHYIQSLYLFFIQWEEKPCDLAVCLSSSSTNHWLMCMVTDEHLFLSGGMSAGNNVWSWTCFVPGSLWEPFLSAFLWGCAASVHIAKELFEWWQSTSCIKIMNNSHVSIWTESFILSHIQMKDEHLYYEKRFYVRFTYVVDSMYEPSLTRWLHSSSLKQYHCYWLQCISREGIIVTWIHT